MYAQTRTCVSTYEYRFLPLPESRRYTPTVGVRDRAAGRGAGQRRSRGVSGSVNVLEERVVAVPAAGVRARVVHGVGDGGCCPWVLAVFSPSGMSVV